MKRSKGERVFGVFNSLLIGALSLSMVLPFVHIFAISLSDNTEVIAGRVNFMPRDLTFDSYRFVLGNPQFLRSFIVSIAVTSIGTLLALTLTVLTAYPLSKPSLKGRKGILVFYIVTMLFSGGLIPSFLLIRALGIYDTIWALILPGAMGVFNMLIMKNYMEGLPSALEESARIDGANDLQVLLRVVLPLITPAIATIGLFYAVGYWNSYFTGIMYISKAQLKPLQTYLYEIVRLSTVPVHELDVDLALNISPRSVQAATVFAATLPILIIYPRLQRYFVKGLVIGSVKG